MTATETRPASIQDRAGTVVTVTDGSGDTTGHAGAVSFDVSTDGHLILLDDDGHQVGAYAPGWRRAVLRDAVEADADGRVVHQERADRLAAAVMALMDEVTVTADIHDAAGPDEGGEADQQRRNRMLREFASRLAEILATDRVFENGAVVA